MPRASGVDASAPVGSGAPYRNRRILAYSGCLVLAVLLLGGATLARPLLLLVSALAGLYAAWRRRRLASAAAAAVAVYAGVFAALAPWAVRNYIRLGEPVLLTTVSGGNFYMSFSREGGGDYCRTAWERVIASSDNELERSRNGYQWGWRILREDPAFAVRRVLTKQRLYLGSDHAAIGLATDHLPPAYDARIAYGIRVAGSVTADAWYLLMMGLPFLGIGAVRKAFRDVPLSWLLLAAILTGPVLHAVYESQPRYHAAYVPFWAMLIAFAARRDAGEATGNDTPA